MTQRLGIREVLRIAVRQAMRDRDRDAVATYRSALAAIDNAEAVPIEGPSAGAIESASLGVGSTEVARRELSEADQRALVRAEIDDLLSAAEAMTDEGAQSARTGARRLDEILRDGSV